MRASIVFVALALVAGLGCKTSGPTTPVAVPPSPEAPAISPVSDAVETVEEQGEGFLRISWRLQTQEDVYGFNVYRADAQEGPYEQINERILPGHGTSALPHEYEYFDRGLTIGQRYYYYVTEVTLSGAENEITPRLSAAAKPRSVYVERGQLAPEDEAP
ncbi:MAG: hypothetical protein PWP23_411 [Candidatus Sumerlaeota bacterium]|nr:hypothetical protein [Candidatus Sumerlaeota bacterium]